MTQGRWDGTARRCVMAALLVSGLICGCGEQPAPQTLIPTVAEQGTSHLRPPLGPQELPDGNSEPPLADVTQAVAGVPGTGGSAGAPEVARAELIRVVSPEQFRDAVAQHKGKVVLVDFWATWCVPCRKLFPHTVELSKKYAGQGLVVISMSFDDPAARPDAEAFLKEQNAGFEHLMCQLGGGDESFAAYEIGDAGLPYFRIYDRTGQLQRVFKNDVEAGKGIEEQDIDAALAELLKP